MRLILIEVLMFSALCLNESSAAGTVLRPIGPPPDTLVLHSTSSFSSRELSVDLGKKGVVGLRVCTKLDHFGSCKVPWITNQRRLSTVELKVLTQLAINSKLFSGRSNGAHMDLAFRWLEVHARNEITMLVTTLNSSFSAAGPRKDLLKRLYALEKELTVPEEP